jgi:hypothetical protein
MTRKLAVLLGVWAWLAAGARADEHGPPDKPPFPKAWATGPRGSGPVLAAPGPSEAGPHEGCGGCGHCGGCGCERHGTCWQRLWTWLSNCPGPAHCHCDSGCGGCGHCGGCFGCFGCCHRCTPCCDPLLYTFFLHRCQGCCGGHPVPGGDAAPRMPEPGDPPPEVLPHHFNTHH